MGKLPQLLIFLCAFPFVDVETGVKIGCNKSDNYITVTFEDCESCDNISKRFNSNIDCGTIVLKVMCLVDPSHFDSYSSDLESDIAIECIIKETKYNCTSRKKPTDIILRGEDTFKKFERCELKSESPGQKAAMIEEGNAGMIAAAVVGVSCTPALIGILICYLKKKNKFCFGIQSNAGLQEPPVDFHHVNEDHNAGQAELEPLEPGNEDHNTGQAELEPLEPVNEDHKNEDAV